MNDNASSLPSRGGCALLALSLVCAAGCRNPLATYEDELGPGVSLDRLRKVEPLAIEDYAREADEPPMGEPLPDPFAGVERLPVSIESLRAWTLENNLDLKVALLDPALASERVTEEEAAFDLVFFTGATYSDIDQPTATALEGTQIEDFTITPGVRIPLRTGGTATIDLPLQRTETNNQFSLLNPSYESDLRFSITQPLLRGAGRQTNTHPLRVAAINQQISESRTKLEIIRQLAEIDRSYWRLYAAQKALEVRQLEYELSVEQLELAQRRVDAGDIAEVEVTRAQSGVASTLENIIFAENLVRERQREIKRIVNVPGLDIGSSVLLVPATDPEPRRYEFDRSELSQLAIARRMELLELELQLAIDESQIAVARNQALPLFTLDYTWVSNGLGDGWGEATRVTNQMNYQDHLLRAQFEYPIGNEAAEARVRFAVLERLRRLSSKEARRLSIRQEVLTAADRVEAGWQRVLAARQAAILAGRTLEAERRQFDVGARTSTDVLDATFRLSNAQLSEIEALTDYQIALVDLAFATGTLLGKARVEWEPLNPTRREGDGSAAVVPPPSAAIRIDGIDERTRRGAASLGRE